MGYEIGQPIMWPCLPDWSNGVTESIAFLSDVMQAGTGAQQVRAGRDVPRRSFAFQSKMYQDARRIVDAFCFDTGMKQFLLPIWPDAQLLGAPLAAGADSIPCSTAGYDFAAGAQAMLWSDTNTWELVTVQAIAADSITLTGATANAWAAGTRLYPVRKARFQDFPKFTPGNDELATLQANVLLDEPCDWTAAWPSAATYRTLPVLEWRGNEANEPGNEFDRSGGTVDYETGPVYYFDMPGMPFRLQAQEFVLVGRTDHTAFRSMLYALNGRASLIWVPSWGNDAKLQQPVADNALQISVNWSGYNQFGYLQANRRDLRIELYDGTVFYRRVIGNADAGDHEVLQLDADLGVAVDPSAVRQINWLTVCALASDVVQISHEDTADGVGRCTLNWQAVKSDV